MRNPEDFQIAKALIADMVLWAENEECELWFLDQAGFSPNPDVQYGWTRVGEQRCAVKLSHGQRVNVMGALNCQGDVVVWSAQQRSTVRDDVIAFIDKMAEMPHVAPRVVLMDNASIHKGIPIEDKRKSWAENGLYITHIPAYSPELNRIENIWRLAKYFKRRFVSQKSKRNGVA